MQLRITSSRYPWTRRQKVGLHPASTRWNKPGASRLGHTRPQNRLSMDPAPACGVPVPAILNACAPTLTPGHDVRGPDSDVLVTTRADVNLAGCLPRNRLHHPLFITHPSPSRHSPRLPTPTPLRVRGRSVKYRRITPNSKYRRITPNSERTPTHRIGLGVERLNTAGIPRTASASCR